MHAAGSPQTEMVMYVRFSEIDMKKKMAKKLAGIKDEA